MRPPSGGVEILKLIKMKTLIRITDEIRSELQATINTFVNFDGLGYDEEKENTIQCAVKQLHEECLNHLPRLKADDFKEALQGLPSYLTVPFENYEIANLMYALGLDFDRDEDDDYFQAVEIYWNECGKYLFEVYNEIK